MEEPKFETSAPQEVKVVYVRKENAKQVKSLLEQSKLLDKRFRMVPAATSTTTTTTTTKNVMLADRDDPTNGWIAIPIVYTAEHDLPTGPWSDMLECVGHQTCPYSTKILGNGGQHLMTKITGSSLGNPSLTDLVVLGVESSSSSSSSSVNDSLLKRVQKLGPSVCPRQLEFFGDDRTLVLPPVAFEGEDFLSLLREIWHIRSTSGESWRNNGGTDDDDDLAKSIQNDFWRRLAKAHKSSRIVRKGVIDPESKIRESGHRLVWPHTGTPSSTGPGSPGWIQVTEQGIKQSFDMTRVMFSRGNISEKIRFGKLVNNGDIVLDMYAGIGYYTLPALVHGGASFVYACEWNEHAANALEYNVVDNKVSERVRVLIGDCRELAKEHNLVNLVDRVSLGLLPSSEGGWRTAVRALKNQSGGWLHVHGNVPVNEKDSWALWVCQQLCILAKEEGKRHDWVVLCNHVERVKSFAPTVCHYVADVFVGPPEYCQQNMEHIVQSSTKAGMLQSASTFVACPAYIDPPSCALTPYGVLCQEWMR